MRTMITRTICCFVAVLFSLTVRVNSQTCRGISQYGKCSTNSECGCFHIATTDERSLCGFLWVTCSRLVPCGALDNACQQPDHVCVHHARCHDLPVCYPLSMISREICPPIKTSLPDIGPTDRWTQNAVTVAGSNKRGSGFDQLNNSYGVFVDDDLTVYVADFSNHRIMEWKWGATSGQVVAGGNGQGKKTNQLDYPTDVVVDKETDSLIICDYFNRRVMRWPRRNGTSGETIISNIDCYGLTMDDRGFVYVSDIEMDAVRRWRVGETYAITVAGGNGEGDRLDQLNYPTFLAVDRDYSLYISDVSNRRVMKWVEGGRQGIVVAGGHGSGNGLTQLSPNGVAVDQLGTVYVSDFYNNRIMRWPKGATQGSIIAGGNGHGTQANQFNGPFGLSFDRHGNLYIVDRSNNRVQRFNIEHSS